MTQPIDTPRRIINGNDSTTNFPFSFFILSTADVLLRKYDAQGVLQETFPERYVIERFSEGNGRVRFFSPPETGTKFELKRNTPINQLVAVSHTNSYDPAVVERVWDKLTMIAQDLRETLGRTFVRPDNLTDEEMLAIINDAASAANDAAHSAAQAAMFDGIRFDTMADLLADTALTYGSAPAEVVIGDYVNTRAEGFGFRVVSDAAPDSRTIVTAGGVRLSPQPTARGLDVRSVGALGDGVADDTAALKKAIEAANFAGCSNVYLPEGEWTHTEKLVFTGGVGLCGDGDHSVLVSTTANTVSSVDSVGIQVASDSVLCNFSLRQAGGSTHRKLGYVSMMVLGVSVANFRITGVRVKDSPASGMLFDNCFNYGVTENFIRDTLADGIHNTNCCESFQVLGNRLRNTADDAISVVSYASNDHRVRNWVIANNVIKDGGSRGVACIGSESGVISGNQISEGKAGIYVAYEASFNTYTPKDVLVCGNHLSDLGEPGFSPVLLDVAENVLVTDNLIRNCTNTQLLGSTSIRFSGNKIDGYRAAHPVYQGAVTASGLNNFEITDNFFSNTVVGAIYFVGSISDSGRVADNTIHGAFALGASAVYADIDFGAGGTNILGQGNLSRDSDGNGPVRYVGTVTGTDVGFLSPPNNSPDWLNAFRHYTGLTQLVVETGIPKVGLWIDFAVAASPDNNVASYRRYLLYYSTAAAPSGWTVVASSGNWKLASNNSLSVDAAASPISSVTLTVDSQRPTITWEFSTTVNVGIETKGVAVYA